MKKVFIPIICFASLSVFCQNESQYTKIKFKVIAECKCKVQFARNDKPVGQLFTMASDSFQIQVDLGTTGFYLTCGESNTTYLKIVHPADDGVYVIMGKMPCDKKAFDKFIFEPYPDKSFKQ